MFLLLGRFVALNWYGVVTETSLVLSPSLPLAGVIASVGMILCVFIASVEILF